MTKAGIKLLFAVALATAMFIPQAFAQGQAVPQKTKLAKQKTKSSAVAAPLDREKYHDVRKAAMQVKSAISVGTSYKEFGSLIQNLQTEIEMLPKPTTAIDSKAVDEFRLYSAIMLGSLDAWKEKLENTSLAPEGGIWVPWVVLPETLSSNARPALVGIKKYGIEIHPIEGWADNPIKYSPSLKGTGYIYADDLIQAYWSDAGEHLAVIDDMFGK